jgi:hypothetical protein
MKRNGKLLHPVVLYPGLSHMTSFKNDIPGVPQLFKDQGTLYKHYINA